MTQQLLAMSERKLNQGPKHSVICQCFLQHYYNNHEVKTTLVSINRYMKKMVYTYNKMTYLAIKANQVRAMGGGLVGKNAWPCKHEYLTNSSIQVQVSLSGMLCT